MLRMLRERKSDGGPLLRRSLFLLQPFLIAATGYMIWCLSSKADSWYAWLRFTFPHDFKIMNSCSGHIVLFAKINASLIKRFLEVLETGSTRCIIVPDEQQVRPIITKMTMVSVRVTFADAESDNTLFSITNLRI